MISIRISHLNVFVKPDQFRYPLPKQSLQFYEWDTQQIKFCEP